MNPLIETVTGLVAGSILIYAGLPVLKAQLKPGAKSSPEERFSRLLIALGNAVWTAYGITFSVWMLSVMCGLQVGVNLWVWSLMQMRKHSPP